MRSTALVNTTLAHYEIGPVIGKGRVGMVFHATDTKDDRPVALKVLLPEFSKNEEEMQRFIRGMKTMLPLRHPNLVTPYAAGKTGTHCWVAMEYIAGENLTQVIERIGVAGMLDWKHAFRAAVHVGRALEYAHGEGIVHRNVTPTNILRDATSKTVKLGDLMLAKALEGTASEQITRPGELVGDVEYMSPERTRGTDEVDAAVRPVRPRGRCLRPAHRPAAVRRQDAGREDHPHPPGRAGQADEVPDVDAEHVRRRGDEAAGEGPEATLCHGGRSGF